MTEPNTPNTPPAGDGGQPPAGSSSNNPTPPAGNPPNDQTPPAGDSGTPAEPDTVDALPKWAQDLVKNLRTENATHRTNQKQAEDANKSEVQRLTDDNKSKDERIGTLETKLRRSTFNERINLPNAKRAWAIAHDEGIEIEFDDDDQPTNLEKVRKALREADPQLFGDGPADAGNRTPAQNGYQGPPGQSRLAYAHSQRSK